MTNPADRRILHLTLHREWFDKIAIGEKTEEYRNFKPHWMSRLEGRYYDVIHFTNGYGKHRPFMEVEFKGFRTEGRTDDHMARYVIQLGKINVIRNWPGPIDERRIKERRQHPTVYHTYGMRSNWDRRLSDEENKINAALIEGSDEYYGRNSNG